MLIEQYLPNFYLFATVFAFIIVFALGFVVFINDRKSITHRFFFLFSLTTIIWTITNSLDYTAAQAGFYSFAWAIWVPRVNVFLAVWYTFFLFQLTYVFPKRGIHFPRWYKFGFVPFAFFTALLTLTPFVFSQIKGPTIQGQIPAIHQEPGIVVFGIFTVGCVIAAIATLFKKYKKAPQKLKEPIRYILLGVSITFPLHIIFNFIFPAFLENTKFIPLGVLFTFPLIGFTAYAIIKYRLLNIRIIATEVFAFLIVGISIAQIAFVRDFTEFLFSLTLLILLIIFSILLIRSMHREIQHRVQEQAYEELRKLDEAKSEFITIASHQFRTPLSAIKGYISMMLEGFYQRDSEEEKKVLQNISTANERLISLTDSLLNVSRMQSGKIDLHKENVQLETLVETLFLIYLPKAQAKNLELVFLKPKKPLPQISIDQEKMRTVIEGVIDNAIRYTKQGKITLSLASRPKSIILKIEDTGKGLSTEERKTVFRSFSRGKTAQALWTEGVGLSLYIAKQFVEAHGGKIWAESPGKDCGSTFYVELPIT